MVSHYMHRLSPLCSDRDAMTMRQKKVYLTFWVIFFTTMAIVSVIFSPSELSSLVKKQLDALKANNIAAAYELTSNAFQENSTRAQFERFVKRYPALKNHIGLSLGKSIVGNHTASLTGLLKTSDGNTAKVEYQFSRERGEWKVSMIRVIGFEAKVSEMAALPSVPMHHDKSDIMLQEIIVSDKARSTANASHSKKRLLNTVPTIFVTVNLVGSDKNGQLEASLMQANGKLIGPNKASVAVLGKASKIFAFARPAENWPVGQYVLILRLSSGQSKLVNFAVSAD